MSRRSRNRKQQPKRLRRPTTPWSYKRNPWMRVRIAEVKLAPMPKTPSGGDWSDEIAYAETALRRAHAGRGL